jgi:hypothetical protein
VQAKSILLKRWSLPAPNRSTLPTRRPMLLRVRTIWIQELNARKYE